jgi:hypothetical protein
MAVQCVLVGKGKDDVFTAVYGETTFDKVLKAYNENKVVQVIYQNRIYYLDNTTVVDSPEAFSFISAFSNQNDEAGEIKHYVISLMTGDSWSGPFLQKSTPATHANTHSKNGDDPLTPADIGAMELSENVLKQSNEDITSQVAQALFGDLVPFSGGTMTGLLNVLTPVRDSNATTKKYVDDALSEKIGMDGIGDLHVWKKTIITKQEIPASFTLGDVHSGSFRFVSGETNVLLVGTPKVNESGVVTLTNSAQYNFNYNSSSPSISDLRGQYCMFTMIADQFSSFTANKVFYIPTDANYISLSSSKNITKYQDVNGTPKIPAEVTTTYPASTNPNAYQEGSDAKPAGYVLGNVITGSFCIGNTTAPTRAAYYVASDISVSDNGVLSISTQTNITIGGNFFVSSRDLIAGKFIQIYNKGSMSSVLSEPFTTVPGPIIYIPNDVNLTSGGDGNLNLYIDRYQPITGYAAIPAGTTIEYLGKLGDKTRVIIGSYIGTGVCGAENPTKIKTSFLPKLVAINGVGNTGSTGIILFFRDMNYAFSEIGSSTNFNFTNITWLSDGVHWYSSKVLMQGNKQGAIYKYIVIG